MEGRQLAARQAGNQAGHGIRGVPSAARLTELAGEEGIRGVNDPVGADGGQGEVGVLRRLDAGLQYDGVQQQYNAFHAGTAVQKSGTRVSGAC